MNKKLISFLLAIVLCATVFAGCKGNADSETLPEVDLLATTTPAPNKMKELADDSDGTKKKVTVLGENLIPNGDFSGGISGWNKMGAGEISACTDEDATFGACLKFVGEEGDKHAYSAPMFTFTST